MPKRPKKDVVGGGEKTKNRKKRKRGTGQDSPRYNSINRVFEAIILRLTNNTALLQIEGHSSKTVSEVNGHAGKSAYLKRELC